MLTANKKITIEAKSVVNGVEVKGFRAVIDTETPDNIKFIPWEIDKAACKEHRQAVRTDQAEFEDYAYQMQDEIINKGATDNV